MVRITASKTEIVDNGCDEVLFAAGDTLRPWNLAEPQEVMKSLKTAGESCLVISFNCR
jgi:hypothetical protein